MENVNYNIWDYAIPTSKTFQLFIPLIRSILVVALRIINFRFSNGKTFFFSQILLFR